MKISVEWLKEYLDITLSNSDLIDQLNNIGLVVDSWEDFEDDVILDIETYANRPDTLGHIGIARELSALLNLPLKETPHSYPENEEKVEDLVDVQIRDEKLCPRYVGMVVRGVEVGPSPQWLQKKIRAMGMNPVNNIVDISNYVLFATGHSIHTFDLDKLKGREVIIRKAKKGEKILCLDETEAELTPEMLVIADGQNPIALAGVIGGIHSAVTESTRDIFIESAYFEPTSIRATAKKLGISTDASYRFERGADISYPPRAAALAAEMMSQFGGKVAKGILDLYPAPRKNKTVVLRKHRCTSLLGLEVENGFIVDILTRLGFEVEEQQPEIWQIKVPFFRIDIEREADLIEEIARFYGYDRIPTQIPPLKQLEPIPGLHRIQIDELRWNLLHHGLNEVLNFSFIDPEMEKLFQTNLESIAIRNPISSKNSQMRTTILLGLLENIGWNKNRGAEGVHIFEVGNIYFWEEEASREVLSLGMMTTGLLDDTHWQEGRRETDFFWIKGACENLLTQLGYPFFSFQEEDHPAYEPGNSAAIYYKGQEIGRLGRISRIILEAHSIKTPVWGAEINLQRLFEKQRQPVLFSSISKFPAVVREMSFIAEQDILFQNIKDAVDKLDVPFLESFSLLDRFAGDPIPKNKVSLSFRFSFRHPKKTLLAEEVDGYLQMILDSLKSQFNFQLREGGKIDKRN